MTSSTNDTSQIAGASTDIELHVNGDIQKCAAETRLPDFLNQIGLNPRLVAVEYNGEILTRALWDSTVLQFDDRLEIVTIVGGG